MIQSAVIGAGKVAQQHMACLASLPGVRMVGVCDLSRVLAESAVDRFGVENWFTDHKQMLREALEAPEAVARQLTLNAGLYREFGAWLREQPPQSILTLHGYFRARGELDDTFNVGRPWSEATGGAYTPFDNWVPVERRVSVAGGCSSTECDTAALATTNMRLRLMPQFNLSDEQLNDLVEFLKWSSEIDTGNWPPNIEG